MLFCVNIKGFRERPFAAELQLNILRLYYKYPEFFNSFYKKKFQ